MANLSELVQSWKQTPEQSRRIVAFGSSNTELFWHSGGRHNWVDWLNINLREHIGRHVLVINQGICGDTTEALQKRFDRDVLPLAPHITLVTIGGNDSMQKGLPFIKQFKANVNNIMDRLVQNGSQPVLQTYYCPFYEECGPGYQSVFEPYMEAVRELAAETGVPLIDYYKYFEPCYRNDRKLYRRLMADSMHVGHYGNFIMGEIASRCFGLPSLRIPEGLEAELTEMMAEIIPEVKG